MEPDVLEVADGVHYVEASHTNFLLVREGEEVTLVDSGYPKDRELLEASLRTIGRRVADVAAMVLTHAHVDHLGSAEWLRATHGVPVHCHEAEAPQARGELREAISQRDLAVRLWNPAVVAFVVNAISKGALNPEHLTAVATFADGESLDVPGTPVAIHTPGHTRGHAALHLPDRGVLIAGDALLTVDLWRRSRRGPQLIRAPFNADHEQALASLARLETLEADVVVPGHGRPYRGTPAQAVAEARAAAGR